MNMRLGCLFFTALLAIVATGLGVTASGDRSVPRTVEDILRSYVVDFRGDPAAAEPLVFGIVVKDAGDPEWHVVVSGKKGPEGAFGVDLHKGLPATPSPYYTTDTATLRRIDAGQLNAMTALGRARMSDPAPMDVGFMPGFQPGDDFLARMLPFTFHFWTRGFPEVVGFGKEQSRVVHGANIVILYYQKGLRSGWARIDKGQHVNEDPAEQTNPFPTMFIGIRGRAVVRIGGVERLMEAGQMIFVPAGVTHEAWNPHDEPAEIILLMFGDGA
jgi:mannose-6-phosphate isomerase-like protein (cupin superfamily)